MEGTKKELIKRIKELESENSRLNDLAYPEPVYNHGFIERMSDEYFDEQGIRRKIGWEDRGNSCR